MSDLQHARLAELCAELRLQAVPAAYGALAQAASERDTPYAVFPQFWLTALGVTCIDPPYSYLSAVDLNTGKLLWTQPFGSSKGSGALGINLPVELPMGTPTHGGSMIAPLARPKIQYCIEYVAGYV